MKKIIGLAFLALSLNMFAHSDGTEHEHVTITQFCEKYYQRSYFVLRLEQIIELIKKIDKKPFAFTFNQAQFDNKLVLECIEQIEQTNSLQPFYKLWKNTRRYKYLEDESFALNVTRLIFTIQHVIYTNTRHADSGNIFDIELHLSCSSYTEATTIRKYHAKRLSETFNFLKTIRCSKRSLFEEEHEGCDCSFITHYQFTNPSILSCIKKMEENKSLEPLLKLYKEFTTYKLIQDDLFVREFTTLAFIVTRNIFIHNIQDPPTTLQKRAKNQVTHIYENLDKLPIDEILEAIDLLNDELPEILNQYEFNSDMTWKEWLKKYWWVPPVVGVMMGARIREILYPVKPSDDADRGRRASEGARRLAEALLSRKKGKKGGSFDPKKKDRNPSASRERLRAQAQKMRKTKDPDKKPFLSPSDAATHTRLADVRDSNMSVSRSHEGLPCLGSHCTEPTHSASAAQNEDEEDSISISSSECESGNEDAGQRSVPLPRRPRSSKPREPFE